MERTFDSISSACRSPTAVNGSGQEFSPWRKFLAQGKTLARRRPALRFGRVAVRPRSAKFSQSTSEAANSKMKAATGSGGITILGIEIGNFQQREATIPKKTAFRSVSRSKPACASAVEVVSVSVRVSRSQTGIDPGTARTSVLGRTSRRHRVQSKR